MRTSTVWLPVQSREPGMMNQLSNALAQIEQQEPGIMPDLRQGQALYVGSDYGGRHQTAQYETYAFVITNDVVFPTWNYLRKKFRQIYIPADSREIGYKKLQRDKVVQRALGPFLAVADELHGLSLTIALNVGIPFISLESQLASMPKPYSEWDKKVLDRMLFVTHVVSLLVAGLSYGNQNVVWVTDRDEIAANPKRKEELANALAGIASLYLPHRLGDLICSTNEMDDDMLLTDFLAIPDLIAGCCSDLLKAHPIDARTISTKVITRFRRSDLALKAKSILDWHAETHHPLKRLLCVIDPTDEPNQFTISWPKYVYEPGFDRSPYVLT